MSLGAQSALEARSGGSTNNGGGFCYSGPTYDATLSATGANTASPVVSSTNYTFVAGDVGNYLYIKTGTNWTPGLYQIVSVSAGNATLNKACGTSSILSSGTWSVDYTQQNSAQFSGTDLVIDATLNTKVTSATHNFTQADVGNWIRISAGSGWTTGWYQINSVSSNAATLDRSPAATSTTGGTWALGGSILITDLPNAMVASNSVWVKAGGWPNITSTISFTNTITANPPSPTLPWCSLIGYTSKRYDGGQVSLTLSTNTGLSCFQIAGSGWLIDGFNINCNSLGTSKGIYISSAASHIFIKNCKISNATIAGIDIYNGVPAFVNIMWCEVTGCTSTSNGAIYFYNQFDLSYSWIHDNSCTGVNQGAGGGTDSLIRNNIISNNTGASSDGVSFQNIGGIKNNIIYKNGRHGIFWASTGYFRIILYNIITDHTSGSGIKSNTAAWPAKPEYDGNFYYNNNQHRTNIDDCGPTSNSNSTYINPVYLSGLYVNTLDVFLTATPFNNAASNDFTLNNTAGGGVLCRGKSGPIGGTTYSGIPGLSSSNGYLDPGVFQHQDTGGSSSPPNRLLLNQCLNNF